MKTIWGKNGYPEVVPNSNWAATTVFSYSCDNSWWRRLLQLVTGAARVRNLEPKWTDIYPFMDDPLFEFRNTTNSPHLTKAQCEIINAPHRKKFWKKEARTFKFALDSAAELARNQAMVMLRRESVYRHKWEQPKSAFESYVGGWLPNKATADGMSQTAIDLGIRQNFRAIKNIEEADLIRKVVIGGGVEVLDFPDGTMWFYSE